MLFISNIVMIEYIYLLSRKIKVLKPIYLFFIRRKWRKLNANNSTRLGVNLHVFPRNDLSKLFDVIKVGKGSYGSLNVYYYQNINSNLIIGNYVSIGHNVLFLLGGNHYATSLFNYPFKYFLRSDENDSYSKGPIVLDDDVWIGMNSTILSGVKIGKGAIVGANSVVSKSVDPYTIVAGNPAKVLKKRFSDDEIAQLLAFDFAEINNSVLIDKLDFIYNKDVSVGDKLIILKN